MGLTKGRGVGLTKGGVGLTKGGGVGLTKDGGDEVEEWG